MEGAIVFDDSERVIERNVGAIVVAVGFGLYDCAGIENLGYGKIPGVVSSLEFERMLASNGPNEGQLSTPDGGTPESVAIVHCGGSLDGNHKPYCSRICCESAFKFNRLVSHKLPGTRIYHLYKELVFPGKDDFAIYQHARDNPDSTFIRYAGLSNLKISRSDGTNTLDYRSVSGETGSFNADMVVLCPAVVPAPGASRLAEILGVPLDQFGFFEELHARTDTAQSKLKGVYLAGGCQAPSDIQESMRQGMASAGYILSGLVAGKQLELDPIVASVNPERCSACKTCRFVCPYKAISFTSAPEKAQVNPLLCQGCGTCVAACPAGAITGSHFTNEQVFAEIEAILQ